MTNQSRLRSTGRTLVAGAVLLVLTLAPAFAESGKVRILAAEAAPVPFSPTAGGELSVSATVAVQEVAGLRGAGRQAAGRADEKEFVAHWTWVLSDASAVPAAEVRGVTALEPNGMRGGPRPGALAHLELTWDGTGDSGVAVADGEYAWLLRVEVVRIDRTGSGRLQEKPLGRDTWSGSLEIDGTPPVIEISGIPDCSRGPVVPVIEVRDANLDSWDAFLDEAPYVPGDPVSADGDHRLAVEARDLAGNTARAERSFVVDTEAPLVDVLGLSDGDVVEPGVAPIVEIRDAHLTHSAVTLDGEPYESGTPVNAPGSHVLRVEAEDCAANRTETEIRFEVVEAGSESATRVFTNEDDRALLEIAESRGGSVAAFGLRGTDGMAERLTGIRREAASPVRLQFDDAGRIAVLEEPDGLRLEFRWLANGAAQMTVADADGRLQTATRLAGPSAAQARPRLDESTLPLTGLSRFRPDVGFRMPAVDLGRSMTPVPPRYSEHAATLPAMPDGSCAGAVRVSTCGVPAEHARVRIRVAGPEGEPYVVPAVDGGEDGFAYSVACDAVAALDPADVCASTLASSASGCSDLGLLRDLGAPEACSDLASTLRAEEALRTGSSACGALFDRAEAACGSIADACEEVPEGVDRRGSGTVVVEALAVSDATGVLADSAEVGASGPFPDFDLRADGEATIARFRPLWVDAETVEITALAACAEPGADLSYTAEICDFDSYGCSTFPVPGQAGPDGLGEIGFQFTSRYGADEVRVTFEVEGGPSRRIVVTF